MEHGLIAWLIVGVIAGWLAGLLIRGSGFGVLGDIILGVLGALFGGWLFGAIGISLGVGWIGSIITATIGAVILVVIAKFVRRAFAA